MLLKQTRLRMLSPQTWNRITEMTHMEDGALPGTWGLVSTDKHWLKIPFGAIGIWVFTIVHVHIAVLHGMDFERMGNHAYGKAH